MKMFIEYDVKLGHRWYMTGNKLVHICNRSMGGSVYTEPTTMKPTLKRCPRCRSRIPKLVRTQAGAIYYANKIEF